MGASKEYFLIMREKDYNELDPDIRALFVHTEVREANEYENNKDDPNYIRLKKAEKTAKKHVQEYLYQKRWKNG